MKKTTLLVALLAILFTAHSQHKIKLSAKAGFGPSKVKTNTVATASAFALSLGVDAYAPIIKNKKIYLNPALEYLSTSYEGRGNSITNKVKVNYLTLSLPITYIATENLFANGQNNFVLGMGPYVGFAVSGKYNTITNSSYTKMKFGNSATDNRGSIDAGLVLKSGISVGKSLFGLQYNLGILNVMPKDRITNGQSIKTRNFLFTFSYNIF